MSRLQEGTTVAWVGGTNDEPLIRRATVVKVERAPEIGMNEVVVGFSDGSTAVTLADRFGNSGHFVPWDTEIERQLGGHDEKLVEPEPMGPRPDIERAIEQNRGLSLGF